MLCDTYLGHNVTHILKSESSTVQQEERCTRSDFMHVAEGQVCPRRPGIDALYLIPALWVLYVRQNYLFYLELTAILAYHWRYSSHRSLISFSVSMFSILEIYFIFVPLEYLLFRFYLKQHILCSNTSFAFEVCLILPRIIFKPILHNFEILYSTVMNVSVDKASPET